MLELQDGRIICPDCGRTTDQVVMPETLAKDLAVFCKRCKRRLIVKIENGSACARA